MRFYISVGLSAALATPALAADLTLDVEIPQLQVAEYHRPYVAIWLERPDKSVVDTVAVWYDVNNRKNEGEKWLKDMRQWWRRVGRELSMPVDGISGATRPPGTHDAGLDARKGPLADLPAGEYSLVIEAAREVGGREVLQIPFSWPPKEAAKLEAKGKSELGTVVLELKP